MNTPSIDSLTAAAWALLWLAAIFVPLEWARPRWPQQRRLRSGLATDLAFFAGQHLLFGALVVTLVSGALSYLSTPDWLLRGQASFAELPLWLRASAALVLGDLSMYWGHRWQHKNSWLWRFHAIHHTSEKLDFVAAHREHPVDGLYTQVFMNLPAILLGFGFEGLLGLVAFRGLWATFIHSNVALPLGPLAFVFGSPSHHHLHHLRDRRVGNYANLAPWIDWLFGTMVEHGVEHGAEGAVEGEEQGAAADDVQEALELGLDEPAPRTYLGLLAWPFIPRGRQL